MAPSLSFVLPVLNEGDRVAALLDRLREQYPGAELVVVDGGSADETVASAMSRCDQLLLSAPARAGQMNLGGRVAAGDYLLFLHADTRPSISSAALLARLQSRPDWGFSRVQLSGGWMLRMVAWCMNQRSRLTRVATGDQMLFVSRELFARSGGFADIPLMEDVEYCKRLRRESVPCILEAPVLTSSRRWDEHGLIRTVLTMWGLRLAYLLGVSPARLHRRYYGG
jgi:rSAM/selenodomain-associated transferase 2